MYNYQPYTGYPQMQNNPYLYGNAYGQQQFNTQSNQFNNIPQQLNTQTENLPGTIVDSIDVVKAKNCNLDGSATYYPKSDKSEIYCKQLNPQSGAGMILTYKLVNPSEEPHSEEQFTTLLSQFKSEIFEEIGELKKIVIDSNAKTTSTKGGAKSV